MLWSLELKRQMNKIEAALCLQCLSEPLMLLHCVAGPRGPWRFPDV